MKINQDYDAVIIGSGMGGMSAGAMLAKDGYKVLILEAAHVPGGCSSSYKRKGYVFESGATTLVGFDENQPLWKLEKETGIRIPRQELQPAMSVWLDGNLVTRYKNREHWIKEAGQVFGNELPQRAFWNEAFEVSDLVWKLSVRNPLFPPNNLKEWIQLGFNNNPKDTWVLKYAFKSVADVIKSFGVYTPRFLRFVNEQLMITAQAKAEETPFLFGAAGLTYTNYSNYYVPGGLLEMIRSIQKYIQQKGGELHTKEEVKLIDRRDNDFVIHTKKKNRYTVPLVLSNIPVWNMPQITTGDVRSYFEKESSEFNQAWGVITMGMVTSDEYPEDSTLHHQLHLEEEEKNPFINSDSIFVSLSKKDDHSRASAGKRVLNVSTHASPELWFELNGRYESAKKSVEHFILQKLKEKLPGFADSEIELVHTATPVTWQNWVSRKKGRVGGIPQNMARSLLNWTSNETPFKGLYLCGDTTYPGQGIPGVTLSGINVYYRIKKNH